MNLKDVKLGMKVVPHSKTPDGRQQGLEKCASWNMAKLNNMNFLYVVAITEDELYPEVILHYKKNDKSGDYFLATDFEPLEEK